MSEPLSPSDVKQLVLLIIKNGDWAYSKHAEISMKERGIDGQDVVNVLRRGVPREGEKENGSWRYRICTQRMTVVIAFRSETRLVVVTAWRSDR